MKKCLALALVLLTLLCACDGETASLEGRFQGEIQCKDRINAALNSAGVGAYVQVDSFALPLTITFLSGGRYEKSVDLTAVETMLGETRARIRAGLEEMAQEKATEAGLDLNAFLKLAELDLDLTAETALNEDAIRALAMSMQGEGRYLAQNGKLYLSAAPDRAVDEAVYDQYECADDTLTLTAPAGAGREGEADLYPIVLTRLW